jgi:hypothetical protein
MVVVLFVPLLFAACDDSGETLYKLSNAVDDPVTVTLSGSLGTLRFAQISGIPIEPREELLGLLGNEILLTVQDPTTGGTADLISGVRVEETPSSPGEYRVSLLDDMSAIMVVFYNQTSTGSTLVAGRTYDAAISVTANDFFQTESFTRLATVQ